MDSDVTSASSATTGALVARRARVRAVVVRATATAGTVELKDGGASGTSRLIIPTPAAVGVHDITLPGRGILFSDSVHATLTDADYVTVIFE